MELTEAMDNLRKVCAAQRLTLDEHGVLQISLRTIREALWPPAEPEEADEETDDG